MKYCPFCGSGLDDEMIFCPKCGRRFRNAHESNEPEVREIENPHAEIKETVLLDQSTVKETEDTFETTIEQATNEVQITPFEAKKKSKKPIIICIIITAIILATAVILGVLFSHVNNIISVAAKSVLFLETYDDDGNLVATASGFIAHDQNTLVTNYHVIDGAYRIVAFTPDRETSVEAKMLLAYDPILDLAILECTGNIGVEPLRLGDSDAVLQGDAVYAVGYPLGVAHTLSNGVVGSRYTDNNGVDTIQITAAISSGSSGGALFNESGEVVGVICASYVDGQNLNVAIAANELNDLLNTEHTSIQLANYYIKNSAYGVTQTNLASGCVFAENDEYRFYIRNYCEIMQINKSTGQGTMVAEGTCLNLYKNKLYYNDFETNDIVQYDIASKKHTPLGLLSNKKNGFMYEESVGTMLIAEDKIFLPVCFTYSNNSDMYFRLVVVDVNNPSNILYFSDFDITNFTYCQSTLFAGIKDNKMLALNMKTLDARYIDIPCNANFEGADDNYFYFTNDDSYGYLERILYKGSLKNFEQQTSVDKVIIIKSEDRKTFLDYYIWDNEIYCLMTCYEGYTANDDVSSYLGKYNATGNIDWGPTPLQCFASVGIQDGIVYNYDDRIAVNLLTGEILA